ncbi:hypothetical protein DPD20_19845 [Salmonella enterica subsp. enterica serovar Tilene]|nr:hypothetical protein [Salmonella enterica subsp. enterica serovar Tilene]EBZ5874365.1 hypothetical protein [Salmonella enterica subsp. enterica serovar Millesi]
MSIRNEIKYRRNKSKSRPDYIPQSPLTDTPQVTPSKLEWIREILTKEPQIKAGELNKRTGLRATARFYNNLRK